MTASATPRPAHSGNPVAEDRIPSGNATFAATCLAILAIPLALQNGTVAGVALLLTLVSGFLYEKALRRTPLSWLPWAISFGLLPAFLSYGGWGGGVHGAPPTLVVTVLSALLGVGVHFLISLPDLVADNKTGMRHLPLRIALKVGAPRLLVISVVWTVLVAIGIVVAAAVRGAASVASGCPRVVPVRSPFRRRIAVLALAVSVPALSACTNGFDNQTDAVYQPAVGVNDRSSEVDVLGAMVVAPEKGKDGVFIASLANNDQTTGDKLTAVDAQGVKADARRRPADPGRRPGQPGVGGDRRRPGDRRGR